MTKIAFILAFLALSFSGLCQSNDHIEILPDRGIILNGDSILLHRFKVEDVRNVLLRYKDYSISTNEYLVTRTYEKTDPQTGAIIRDFDRYSRTIKYHNLTFDFEEKDEPIDLRLVSIRYGKQLIE